MSDSDDILSSRDPRSTIWMDSDEDNKDKENIPTNQEKIQPNQDDSDDHSNQSLISKSKKLTKKRKRIVKLADNDASSNDEKDQVSQQSKSSITSKSSISSSNVSQNRRFSSDSSDSNSNNGSQATQSSGKRSVRSQSASCVENSDSGSNVTENSQQSFCPRVKSSQSQPQFVSSNDDATESLKSLRSKGSDDDSDQGIERIDESEFDDEIKNKEEKLVTDVESNKHTEDAPKKKKYLLLSDDDLADSSDEKHSNAGKYSSNEEANPKEKRKISKDGNDSESKPRKSRKKKNITDENGENQSDTTSRVRKHRKSSTVVEEKRKQNKTKPKDTIMEIKSTTQKMIREGRIALPYHQPKQRSLEEFLQRRTKILSIPLRPSFNSLSIIDEHLQKKEEEVAEFYKSDSDVENTGEISSNDSEMDNEVEKLQVSDNDQILKNIESVSDIPTNLEKEISKTESDTNTIQSTSDLAMEIDPNLSKTESNTNLDAAEVQSKSDVEINSNLEVSCPSYGENLTNSETITGSAADISNFSTPKKCVSEIETNFNFSSEKMVDSCLDSDFSLQVNDSEPETVTGKPISNFEDDSISILDKGKVDFSENTENDINDAPQEKTNIDESKKNAQLIRDRKFELLSKLNIELPSSVTIGKCCSDKLEFEVMSVKKPGVQQLIEKFMKHTVVENKPKTKTRTLNILRTETDTEGEIIDVVKESLSLTSTEELSDQKFTLPGSKHTHFKSAMLKTLINKKEANWKEYQKEKRRIYASDNDEDEYELDLDSRKPNFEPYHPEDEPDDDELIEDDIDIVDDRDDRKKNKFVDEEAEVSFDEDENLFDDCDDEKEDSENSDEDEDADVDGEDENEEIDENKKTKGDNEVCDEKAIEEKQVDQVNSTEEKGNTFKIPEKLFRSEITAEDLENKLLGLDTMKTQDVDESSNSQIFSICSGKFATQLVLPSQDENLSQFSFGEDSQNFNLSMQETNDDLSKPDETPTSFIKSNLLLSDESDTEELFVRKKKTMRIQDSDDEDAPNESSQEDELDDEENEEEEDDGNENEDEVEELIVELEGEVGYNSEEEIVSYQEKAAPTDFFENEAELSESDWGSEDENEKDLDELEKEAGDDDDIDTEKLKEELGKIHMRQLLDDDQKDVRLLKEMLLEDGELHSDAKRNRKFQWKNLDGKDFFLGAFNDSDDENEPINDNDAETEENWRKIRHEREMFLSQQEKRNELLAVEDDDTSFVHISKTKITTKINIGASAVSAVDKPLKSPTTKLPVNIKYKCGSFLSRGRLLLDRIAGNVQETKDNVKGVKNGRNFVFAAISPEKKIPEESSCVQKGEKRKISKTAVMTTKKMKLSSSLQSPSTVAKTGLLAQLALSE